MKTIRYAAPQELVFRWTETTGETLKEAAANLVNKEKWKLGGTAESLHWVSVKLVIPDHPFYSPDDRHGQQIFSSKPGPQLVRRQAKIICVSTGSKEPGLLCPPGEPRQTVLDVTVPAETTPGEIDLM